jgi:hypothetical protein
LGGYVGGWRLRGVTGLLGGWGDGKQSIIRIRSSVLVPHY